MQYPRFCQGDREPETWPQQEPTPPPAKQCASRFARVYHVYRVPRACYAHWAAGRGLPCVLGVSCVGRLIPLEWWSCSPLPPLLGCVSTYNERTLFALRVSVSNCPRQDSTTVKLRQNRATKAAVFTGAQVHATGWSLLAGAGGTACLWPVQPTCNSHTI